MALSIEDLLTREEIRDTLTNYSQGLDQRNWDLYDRVWTDDATFEAPDEGIGRMGAGELKAMLQGNNDPDRLAGQHLLNNTHFQIDGDSARTVTEVTWVTLQTMDKPGMVFEVRAGGIYVDDLVRTAEGWRIRRRVLVTKNKSTRGVAYPPERIENIRRYSLDGDWFL
ncbi:nuclear transport factor 2 family protein [uncultured Propionibacterium sp.]|uniref:nuclear transport factor 2 family protein n=1 Tax=uncultured Propionibacterium sp. TaxID=218066 RepID=UPI00292DF3CE|nr:nuclear transport factor 2 family protein [uncultured Propionibacterium sp.]